MRDIFGHTRQLQSRLDTLWHKLYRVAYAWTHDRHLAADLAQETVTRALTNREKFDDERHLQLWLFRVMVNCWRDTFRRQRITEDINDDTLMDAGQQPDEHCEQQQIVQRVRRAVSTLNFDQRQVITLVVLEGCSYEETATILAIPVGTVMSRISRARQQLQTNLQDLRNTDSAKPVWRIK